MAPRTTNPSQSKSSAKKKPVVNKKGTNAKVKVCSTTNKRTAAAGAAAAVAATVAKPLPADWPVASQPPKISAKESALRPGSLLQEACNGRDIHINKQALMAPNLSKERGRYLLIFPGNFSFRSVVKPSTANATTTTTTTTNDGSDLNEDLNLTQDTPDILTMDGSDDDDEDEDDENDNGNIKAPAAPDDNVAPSASASASTKEPSSSLPQLGRVEGLSTDTPRFRIDFPDGEESKRSLIFPGTKVTTSSKYMWLNCSTRKKGSVACKGIFSSAIVFGTPVWETVSTDGKVNQEMTTTQVEDDSPLPVDDDSSTNEKEEGNERKPEWVHYGGSDRTIDGVYRGSKKKKKGADSLDPLTSHIPIISKAPIFDERGLPLRPAAAVQSPMVKTAKAVTASAATLQEDSEADNDFDNDSDDEEFTASVPTSSVKARAAPRRQASAKKAKYAVDLLDSDVGEDEKEESSSSDGDDDQEKDKKLKSDSAARHTFAATKTKTAKTERVDDDDQSDSQDKKPPKKIASNGRRKSTKPTVSLLDDDSDDSSLGLEVKASKQQETKVRPVAKTTKKQPAASKSKKNNDFSLSSDDEDTFAMSDDEDIPASSTNHQSSSRRVSRRCSAKKKPSYAETKNDREDDDDTTSNDSEKSDKDDIADSLSAAPLKPKAHAAKTQATKTVRNRVKKQRAASAQSKSVLELFSIEASSEKPASHGSKKRKPVACSKIKNGQQIEVSRHSGDENLCGAINVDDQSADAAACKRLIKRPKTPAPTTMSRRRDSSASAVNTATGMGAPKPGSPLSPAMTASPFRSRRRKTPGSATSSAKTDTAKRNVFDLSQDEDFQF